MKIAIFASAFHPSLGGVEELVRQQAHALERAGHEVLILTQRWPRDLPAFEKFEGLRVHRFAFRMASDDMHWRTRLRATVSAFLTGSAIRREIAGLLREEGVEIVHVQCVSASALYALHAAKTLHLPLVVTLQGELSMDATRLFERSQVARDLMRDCLSEAQAITACSGQTLAEAQEFWGRPFGERGEVIYNGIRLSDFAPHHDDALMRPHQAPFVLGIGRHVPQKGFDVLLEAYARAVIELGASSQNGPSLPDLVLAGDGSHHEELKARRDALAQAHPELEGRIHFPGRADRKGAVNLFKSCELFVLPSRHEPMGIVNLEAMAAGRAVIASRVGGVPELVRHGENGLLVAPDSPEELAGALTRLIRNPEETRALGERGRAFAADFDWDALAKRYLATYERARQRL